MTYALVLFSAVTALVVSISAIGTAPAPNSKWPEIHSEKTSRLVQDDVPRGGVARSIVELSGQGREQVNLPRAS
ncbi:hypothetical protein [Rhizobium leguminosarum]|uniref:hypothetical protein n=1 Tax=Rhizobium leguminosarum TaxID=384 RepID=UPI0015FDF29C|nr:hypothetical protein [Rhizobium leguminosarum]MBA9032848.1 hypothetical protein [Rhizobium leguminosarum]